MSGLTEAEAVLCACGCGQPAPISDRTDRSRGYVKGEPRRFVIGHKSPTPEQVARRFWLKVEKSNDCWIWVGEKRKGYGRFWLNGARHSAHRVSYGWLIGPIPDGLVLDHRCRNRSCVRPDHLEPVTNRVNVLRGVGVTARAALATHCPREHPYNEVNTYISKQGHRHCRTCHRNRQRERAEGARIARETGAAS